MSVFKPIKVTSLPGTPATDAVYYVKGSTSSRVRVFVTDSAGTAYLVGEIVESPFTPLNSAVVAGDTFQQASEKLQGQISNIASNYLQLSGGTMTGYITLHADPTQAFHAATKQYVDSVAEGLHIHAAVKVATNGTLASLSGGTVTYNNGTSGVGATLTLSSALTQIDGYSLVNGDRVLVKNEVNKAHNGIYVRTSSTVFTRATDYNTLTEINSGDFVFVSEGTSGGKTGWVQILTVNTIGTSDIEWQQFSGSGTYVGSTSIILNGTSFERAALTGDVTASQNSNSLTIASNAVSNAKFRQSAGLSLVGRSANTTGDVADITAGSDHQVLRRSGTSIAFGAVNLASSNAVTGLLPIANGGTNSGTALSNNRIMISSSGAIIEATAITANRALISDANGIPVHSAVTNTELGHVSGVTSAIQTQLNNRQPLAANLTSLAGLTFASTSFVKMTAAGTFSLDTNTYLTGNQTITLSGDATGSGTTSIAVTLANSGVTEGTYRSVTVDVKGRVTAGTNPTTISGYGITDFYAQVVSGFVTGANSTVLNTDSLEVAIEKLQGQVNARISANQTITLSGDVTGSGTTAITATIANNAVTTAKILDANVTYAKIQNVTANRLLGRITTSGTAQELTASEVRTLLNVADGATANTGTVTSVGLSSATSGVTFGSTPVTTSGTITIEIATATGSQNGLLSSADWTTFNAKIGGLIASGQVAFGTESGVIGGDNNLFWDNTNKRLGIGISSPRVRLEVSDDLIISKSNVWTARTTPNDAYQRIAYGNGIFVAVAAGTNFITSSDGINWTSRTVPNASYLSIAYGNGLFVAVSTSNVVATSSDGITWTSRTNASNRIWRSVTYGNGLFVAVASSVAGNRVATSPDGINWTSRTTPADNNWWAVTYGNGLFVAVAQSGTGNRVMTSSDGITWTLQTSASDSNWNDITYGKGLFVACASNAIMTSPDGVTWTSRTAPTNNNYHGITYGNGVFVTVNTVGGANGAATSVDGITWVIRSLPASNQYRGIAYGNGLFVAVSNTGTDNRVATSGAVEQTLSTPINRLNGDWYYTGNLIVGAITDAGGQRVQVVGNTELGNSILQTFTGVASASMRINSGGNLLFGLDSSTGATERARITSNGRLLIGTTTESSQLLQVAGTVALRASASASAATQIPVFTADPSSTTRELVTRTPAQLLGDAGGVSGSGTTNELAYFTGASTIASLSTATYPSLTELSYVKGVTSAIQTQLNAKEPTLTKGNLTEATSSVLTITGGTNAVIGSGTTIQVRQATTSVSGFLSSTDWNTFNAKIGGSIASGQIAFGTASGVIGGDSVFVFNSTSKFVGIGETTPTARLHLAASTTAGASLRITAGVAPTTPNIGDAYYDSSLNRLRWRSNSQWIDAGMYWLETQW